MKLLPLLFSSALLAQISPPTTLVFRTSDPAGACSPASTPLRYITTNGKLWSCQGSVWTQMVAGGGGGTPGGSDTQVQFNDAAAFGGNAGLTFNKTTKSLTVNNTAVPTGAELITDGNFTTCPGGWTLGNNVACGAGVVTSTSAGGDPSITSATFATVSGTTYLLTFTISEANAQMYYYFANNGSIYLGGPFQNGTHVIAISTDYTGASETIAFDSWNADTGDAFTLDNVSFKAVPAISQTLNVVGYDGSTVLSIGGNTLGNLRLGVASLQSLTSGRENVAIGDYSSFGKTTGHQSAAVGWGSLGNNSTGGLNSSLGYMSLFSNISGGNNTALGHTALTKNDGSNNTAVGTQALLYSKSGSGLVALGLAAGIYESGSNAFYVDNQDRGTEAAGKAGSLLYGTFHATPTSQTLNTPGLFSANQITGSGAIPSVATCGTIGTGSKNNAGFITSATTGSCVSVLTFSLATATTGWSCGISNGTTANLITQTGSSTTTATFTGETVSGDVLRYNCVAY